LAVLLLLADVDADSVPAPVPYRPLWMIVALRAPGCPGQPVVDSVTAIGRHRRAPRLLATSRGELVRAR
jgi:hypothetical protein